MSDFVHARAKKLLQAGLEAVSRGEIETALHEFEASARLVETAEALTYWGWMEHQLGHIERAIELCRRAIAVDPSFGNPYNDIGSYLIAQGKFDEAAPWFEKAIQAPNYEPRHFPHLNLGRVHLAKGRYRQALDEFRKALTHAPGDPGIQAAITRVETRLRTLN